MAASSLASVGAVRLSVILGGPASVVLLLGGTTVPPPSGIVTVEYSAEFDARSRRRAHESIDCVLKNSEAFGRAFEDCVIKRGEKRHGIAGYPRHQLGPQRTCARAAAAGTVRRRATSSAAARRGRGAGWLWLQDLPSRRPTVITSALEPSTAPDDVPYGRRRAAIISTDLGNCFALGILGQNLRPFAMRDLSFCSRICHRFLAFCYALIIAISFDYHSHII